MLEKEIAADRAAGLRPCVGLIVLHNKQVFLGQQATGRDTWIWAEDGSVEIDDSIPDWKFALQIPQGGVEEGEDATQAFFREAREEFGLIATTISEPEFIMRTETRFRLERDGVRYQGNSIYYCAVDVGHLGMGIAEFFDMFMDADSDDVGPPYPTPGFPGGIHLYNHEDAVISLRANRQGRKTDLMVEVLDELLRHDLLKAEGGLSFYGVDIEYSKSLPPDDPCSIEAVIREY